MASSVMQFYFLVQMPQATSNEATSNEAYSLLMIAESETQSVFMHED